MNYLQPLGRALLAAIFLMSGFGKIMEFNATAQMMGSVGFPIPALFLIGAIMFEIFGGLSVLLGYKARWGALALFLFMIPTTLIFHASHMGAGGQEGQMQMIHTLKNLAIMGGLLILAANGGGRYSLDEKLNR